MGFVKAATSVFFTSKALWLFICFVFDEQIYLYLLVNRDVVIIIAIRNNNFFYRWPIYDGAFCADFSSNI